MHKIIKIVLIVFGLIGAVLWFMLPTRELSEADPAAAAESTPMALMFYLTYILIAIAVLVSLVYSLKNLFSTPDSLKKALYVIGGLAIIVGISYALANGTDVNIEEMAGKGIETSESTIRKIGTGLNVFFFLTVIAVGLMLWSGVKKLFVK